MEILSVLLAALGCYIAGAVYYMSLSKQWLEAAGITPDGARKGDMTPFIIGAITAVISAGMMRHVLHATNITTISGAIMVGAGIGAFFVGSWIFLNNGYEGKSIKLSVINTGYAIIGLTIQAIILTIM